jgi:hypothetical protein
MVSRIRVLLPCVMWLACGSGGSESILATGDAGIDTPGAMQPVSVPIVIHMPALAADCGDALVVRVQHVGGTQTLLPFELALDVP